MPGSTLVRSRALRWCAGAALAAGVAGCTAANSSPTLSAKTLTIYLSAPASLVSNAQAEDVIGAERLAFDQLHNQVSAFGLRLRVLTGDALSTNARTAIEDTKSAIAYLGEIVPGASADSLGITNAEDLLQVSPTDTAVELTQATPAIRSAPSRYYESLSTYSRTFARVVPTTLVEAGALVDQMRSLGVRRLYVTTDGSEYGKAVALAVSSDAAPGITVASSPAAADAVFFGGSSPGAAASALDRAVAGNPALKLFAPSALANDAFAASLAPAAQRQLFVSSPGLQAKQLDTAARKFVSDFQTTYGHRPDTQALFGYAAMAAVLDVLKEAGASAGNRSLVVQDFMKYKSESSVLGSYSINGKGDTSFASFVFSRIKSGKLVPLK